MINLMLLLTVAAWGMSFIATKAALGYLTPVEIVAVRLLLGTPVLYLVILIKKIDLQWRRSDMILLMAASAVMTAHFLIQAVGLEYTSATNTAWLVATIPIFIAIFSRIFLKEKMTILKFAGISLATLGVLLLVSKGEIYSLGWLKSTGDWIILSSAVTWTIYTVLTRDLSRRYHPLSVTLLILILPAVILNGYAASTTPISKLWNLPVSIMLAMAFLGVICLGLAQWVWMEGLARKGATEVGVFIYLEPLVTTAAAIPILDEKLTLFTVIGAILIIGGVYMVQKKFAGRTG
ncbi:putative Uncharacterized transporter AF_0510 [Candidatus Zixiibacteriota bacterium]|nr:putative Uncharacterized transporter AF_0510 [candidate division Zixibacteria bacterium]